MDQDDRGAFARISVVHLPVTDGYESAFDVNHSEPFRILIPASDSRGKNLPHEAVQRR